MAETTIQVQPAATAQVPAPAPLPLKMFIVSDGQGQGGQALLQGIAIVDDQGRAQVPMTEATGQAIVKLLNQLLRVTVEANGGFYPTDENPG